MDKRKKLFTSSVIGVVAVLGLFVAAVFPLEFAAFCGGTAV